MKFIFTPVRRCRLQAESLSLLFKVKHNEF